jgi:hypothetical protein
MIKNNGNNGHASKHVSRKEACSIILGFYVQEKPKNPGCGSRSNIEEWAETLSSLLGGMAEKKLGAYRRDIEEVRREPDPQLHAELAGLVLSSLQRIIDEKVEERTEPSSHRKSNGQAMSLSKARAKGYTGGNGDVYSHGGGKIDSRLR